MQWKPILLNAVDFPPLQRPVESYRDSTTQFYGYFEDDQLAGVIEMELKEDLSRYQQFGRTPGIF